MIRQVVTTASMETVLKELPANLPIKASTLKSALELFVSPPLMHAIHVSLAKRMIALFPDVLMAIEPLAERQFNLRDILYQRMSRLSPESFERLLHPVFEEDEWKLIVVGGVLGAAIGAVQMFVLGA